MPSNPGSQEIVAVTQDSFVSFVAQPAALVYAAPGAKPELLHRFMKGALAFSIPPVTIGVIDLSTVQWTGARKAYVLMQLGTCGLSPDMFGQPGAGYYLFSSGALRGFHPGTVDPEQDGGPLKFGAVTFVLGMLAKSKEIREVGKGIWNMNAASRVVTWVRERLEATAEGAPGASPTPEIREALQRAYAALGLTPDASDEDVRAAHRRLVREHHPDRFVRDPEQHQRATVRTAELNAARDLILDRHAPRRRAS
jgi:hypothetical protein